MAMEEDKGEKDMRKTGWENRFAASFEESKRRARAFTLREDDRESAERYFKFTTAEEFIKQ